MKPSAPSWQLASDTILPASQINRRLYFFDEALPAGSRNIRPVYAPVKKLGVVLEGDAPWENDGSVATFCSTILRLDDNRYRMYYTTFGNGSMRMAVAESDDGLTWQRRPLGQEKWQGHDTNRIVLTGVFDQGTTDPEPVVSGLARQNNVCQPQVLRLPDGRWRMYYWHHPKGWGRMGYFYTVAESDDGLKWDVPHFDRPILNSHWVADAEKLSPAAQDREKAHCSNDANYVYWNPRLGCYEQFSQWFVDAVPDRCVDTDNMSHSLRMIQRRVSADGLEWSAPELVIQADGHDPWDQQFYHLAVQYHEDWMIGSLGHYRVEDNQQTIDLELVFSRDGRRWERPVRGGFIPREAGSRDAESLMPPNAWIDQDDRWLCLYTGVARKHNQARRSDLPPQCIMAATWAKHRFVGLRAERLTGGFMTPVFYPQADEILIDADVRGWLRAELCDIWGRKLDGYRLGQSLEIRGDDPAHALRWNGRTIQGCRHTAIRLRLEFSDADVYGVIF